MKSSEEGEKEEVEGSHLASTKVGGWGTSAPARTAATTAAVAGTRSCGVVIGRWGQDQHHQQQPNVIVELDATYDDLAIDLLPAEGPAPVVHPVLALPHTVVVLHHLQEPVPVVVVQEEPVEPQEVEGGVGEIDWAVLEERITDAVQQREPGELSADWARVLRAVVMRGRLEQHRRLHDQANQILPNYPFAQLYE